MKRIWLVLVIGAIVLLMAGPVGAVKPDKPDTPPVGPTHPEGLTCEDFAVEHGLNGLAEPAWTDNGFTLTLTPEANSACIDLDVDAADWTVEASLESALSYIFSIKDSVPGDFCFFYPRGSDATVSVGVIPGAFLNACGDEYSEYGNFAIDPATPDPLVFQAWAKVKKGGTVTLEVMLTLVPTE